MTYRSPIPALVLYLFLSGLCSAALVHFLGLPQTHLGVLGTLAAFSGANYFAFFVTVGRYGIVTPGGFGFSGPWAEALFLAPAVNVIVTLLFPFLSWITRFGSPTIYTVLGIVVEAACYFFLVATTCGGDDWREAAEQERKRRAARSPQE